MPTWSIRLYSPIPCSALLLLLASIPVKLWLYPYRSVTMAGFLRRASCASSGRVLWRCPLSEHPKLPARTSRSWRFLEASLFLEHSF